MDKPSGGGYLFSRTGNINMVWWAWPLAECVALSTILYFNRVIHKKVIEPLKTL